MNENPLQPNGDMLGMNEVETGFFLVGIIITTIVVLVLVVYWIARLFPEIGNWFNQPINSHGRKTVDGRLEERRQQRFCNESDETHTGYRSRKERRKTTFCNVPGCSGLTHTLGNQGTPIDHGYSPDRCSSCKFLGHACGVQYEEPTR